MGAFTIVTEPPPQRTRSHNSKRIPITLLTSLCGSRGLRNRRAKPENMEHELLVILLVREHHPTACLKSSEGSVSLRLWPNSKSWNEYLDRRTAKNSSLRERDYKWKHFLRKKTGPCPFISPLHGQGETTGDSWFEDASIP